LPKSAQKKTARNSTKAGFETSGRNPDGSLEFYYEFNDRGRGPKVTEDIVPDGQGIPAQLENRSWDRSLLEN
jgi:hypothetical protein